MTTMSKSRHIKDIASGSFCKNCMNSTSERRFNPCLRLRESLFPASRLRSLAPGTDEWLSCWMAAAEVAPRTRARVGRPFEEPAAMHRRVAHHKSKTRTSATFNDKSPDTGNATLNTMATSQEIDHDRRRFGKRHRAGTESASLLPTAVR